MADDRTPDDLRQNDAKSNFHSELDVKLFSPLISSSRSQNVLLSDPHMPSVATHGLLFDDVCVSPDPVGLHVVDADDYTFPKQCLSEQEYVKSEFLVLTVSLVAKLTQLRWHLRV